MRQHHPPGNDIQDYISLEKDNGGKFYSKNPNNIFVSKFADEFRGFLNCGSVDNLYMKRNIFQDL